MKGEIAAAAAERRILVSVRGVLTTDDDERAGSGQCLSDGAERLLADKVDDDVVSLGVRREVGSHPTGLTNTHRRCERYRAIGSLVAPGIRRPKITLSGPTTRWR